MRTRRTVAVASAATITSLLCAQSVHAAASSVQRTETGGPTNGPVIRIAEDFSGPPNIVNDITVTRALDVFSIVDPGEITLSGSGSCVQGSTTEVTCPAAGVEYMQANLAGGDDRLVLPANAGFGFAQIRLGAGGDSFQGGDEPDEAHGATGDDLIRLGGGDDDGAGFSGTGGAGGSGADQLFGEAGDDVLTGDAIDEGGPAITPGPDTLDGGDGDDRLEGNGGADTLIGGAGNDRIFDSLFDAVEPQSADILSGGDGDDLLNAGVGGDSLDGGPGNDAMHVTGGTASGGDGNDIMSANAFMTAGSGNGSSLDGGAGDDILQGLAPAFDAPGADASDELRCGDGTGDIVVPGPGDVAGTDCEFVYELVTCGAATCDGSITVVAPLPGASGKVANANRTLVLAEKHFTVRKGVRAKKAKFSRSAVRKALKGRGSAAVTKKVELGKAGPNARKAKRTKVRFKLSK